LTCSFYKLVVNRWLVQIHIICFSIFIIMASAEVNLKATNESITANETKEYN